MTKFTMLKLGFAVFSVLGLAGVALAWMIRRRIGRLGIFTLAAILFGCLLVVYAFWLEPNWIEVTRVRFRDPALAETLQGIKIIHITDIHIHKGLGFRERRLMAMINRLAPDFIFFTGDLLDDLSQLPYAREFMAGLNARIAKIGVAGDTDLIVLDALSFKREMALSGMEILVNESRELRLPGGRVLWITGLDPKAQGRTSMHRALELVPEGASSIVLAPSPDVYDRVSRNRNNLLLVGDTHGGQIGFEWLVRMSEYAYRTPYIKGLFRMDRTTMYVNRGIGMKTIYLRFLCRPEVALIEPHR